MVEILNTRWRERKRSEEDIERRLELLVKTEHENKWLLLEDFPSDSHSLGKFFKFLKISSEFIFVSIFI